MLKSKLFLKSVFMIIVLTLIYYFTILFFILPQVNSSLSRLEKKDAKDILNSIVVLTTNVHKNLEVYREIALQNHEKELKNLTDTVWSIISSKYEQSKPENIGKLLEKRSKEFEKNLLTFYNKNRYKMSKRALKKAIKNYINIYRYENGIGYFWINDFKPKMILHPIATNLNGKYLGNYKDPNGVDLFNQMVKVCNSKGKGVVKYQWLNPKSKKIEDKLSYVFTFKPFHWIIGTGEYTSVLRKRLQQEVIDIVRDLRYGDGNYFFIYDYNNIAISHPYIQGKDMSNVKDKKGNLIVPPFVKLAQKDGEGFTRYWWPKNKNDTASYEKLTYVKDFPNWNMVIATGIFIDDIEKEVAKRKEELIKDLKTIVNHTKIGDNGYLFIFDKDANMLIHPNKYINGTNISRLINPTDGGLLFNDLVNASQTKSKALYYKWDKPDENGNYIYDKISWTRYVDELGWYITSSLYVEDFKKSSNEIHSFISNIFLGMFLVTIVFSIYFFRKMLLPIYELSKLSQKVTEGDYSVRANIIQNDEIGVLAKSFNTMLNITEDFIDNLEMKIDMRTKALECSKREIEAISKHTQESIEYASLIQGALIPNQSVMTPFFQDNFVMWTPKDTVGGDIWLFEELRHKDECLLMYIDCTGHGVPGAFVTMIVKAIEREIIAIIKADKTMDVSPAWVMGYFNKMIKILLKQETKNSVSNAGFDGGIIYYNKRKQILKFSGAETPLFYMTTDDELKTIKGNRYSVGYKKCDINHNYKETTIKVEKGMKFYCTTDGYLDQNGGEKGFPFGKKRFSNVLKEHHKQSMDNMQKILQTDILEYEEAFKDNDRNDDMTVIGFEIGEKSDFVENRLDEVVKYEGVMTQNVISATIDNVEAKVSNMTMRGIVATLTIEYCQNMMKYSKGLRASDTNTIVPAGKIEVQYINNNYYEIEAINIISKNDKNKIEPKLQEIQSLDRAGIKKRYRELRKSGKNTHKQGGGIGLYEIAKVSDKILYEFHIINENKYRFVMKSIIYSKDKGSLS